MKLVWKFAWKVIMNILIKLLKYTQNWQNLKFTLLNDEKKKNIRKKNK